MHSGTRSSNSRLFIVLVLFGIAITTFNVYVYFQSGGGVVAADVKSSRVGADARSTDGDSVAPQSLDDGLAHRLGVRHIIAASEKRLDESVASGRRAHAAGGVSEPPKEVDVEKQELIADETGGDGDHLDRKPGKDGAHHSKHGHESGSKGKGKHRRHAGHHGKKPHHGGSDNEAAADHGSTDEPAPEHHADSGHHHSKAPKHHAPHGKHLDEAVQSIPPSHPPSNDAVLSSASPAPALKRKMAPHSKVKYVAHDSNRTNFSPLAYDEAVKKYHEFMETPVGDEIEQSSRKFKDYFELDNAGVRLPTDPDDLKQRFDIAPDDAVVTQDDEASVRPYCDPADFDFTPEKDALCLQYLADIRNWQSIKPMSSILSTGRTIKFKVFYKHNDIAAAMKVSQKKFALEPASEVMAFQTDRVLELNRVPPVVWVPFPVEFLQAASAMFDPFYAQWFQAFVLNYTTTQPLLTKCFNGRFQCVNVSLQIWMFDVHDADETSMKPRHGFEKFLTLPTPSDVHTDDIAQGTALHNLLAEMSDLYLFDYIIGNTDRWFGHNSFAVGGYKNGEVASSRRTRSTPRLAFIDQGSSFYKNKPPDMNAYTKDEKGALCRFRESTMHRLLEICGDGDPDEQANRVYLAIKERLPSGIFNLGSSRLLKGGAKRAVRLAGRARKCLEAHKEADVLYFSDLPTAE